MHLKRLGRFMCLLLTLCVGSAMAGPVLTVKSKDGRTMEIELVRVFGDRVSFNRTSDAKSFELPMSAFDAESAELINSKKAELPPAHPNYVVDVVIEKRRKLRGSSSYVVEQNVSARIQVRNPTTEQAPKLTLRMIYLGDSRGESKEHTILGVSDYQIELASGAEDKRELETIQTVYDDYRGSSNFGGYQYAGYLLLLMDEKGTILSHKTTMAGLTEEVRKNPALLVELQKIRQREALDNKFYPTGKKSRFVIFGN